VDSAEDVRARLIAEGPTPCAELNLMLKYDQAIACLDGAVSMLEQVIQEVRP
jgi:hypothetical protein